MKHDDELDVSLDALRSLRTAVPVEHPENVATRREKLVGALETEIRAAAVRERKARRFRRMAGFASLAAGFALLVGGGVALHARVTAQTLADSRALADGRALTSAGSAAETASKAVAPKTQPASGAPQATSREHAKLVRATLASWSTPSQSERPLVGEGAVIEPGTELRTLSSGWLELELPSRARIEMSEKSTLGVHTLSASEQHLSLALGRVDVSVPKPQDGNAHRLLIVTPDSEVEVRGTVFSVEVRQDPEDPRRTITEVFVSRGAVAVRHAGKERLIQLGGHFRSDEADAEQNAGATQGEALAPGQASSTGRPSTRGAASPSIAAKLDAATKQEADASSGRTGTKGAPSSVQDTRSSTLGEQNRLFERALAARDGGDLKGAVALFDQILTRFPTSPLLSSVRTERSRALAKLSSAQSE